MKNNEPLTEEILVDLLKDLAAQYDKHAKMHRKNARFWLAVLFLQITLYTIFIIKTTC